MVILLNSFVERSVGCRDSGLYSSRSQLEDKFGPVGGRPFFEVACGRFEYSTVAASGQRP